MRYKQWVLFSLFFILWGTGCKTSDTESGEQSVLRLGMVPFETGEELLKDITDLNSSIKSFSLDVTNSDECLRKGHGYGGSAHGCCGLHRGSRGL